MRHSYETVDSIRIFFRIQWAMGPCCVGLFIWKKTFRYFYCCFEMKHYALFLGNLKKNCLTHLIYFSLLIKTTSYSFKQTGLFYKHLCHWLICCKNLLPDPFPPNLQNIITSKPVKLGTKHFKKIVSPSVCRLGKKHFLWTLIFWECRFGGKTRQLRQIWNPDKLRKSNI